MSDAATTQTAAQKLARPFAVSEHATVKKGGSSQTYAPWTEYVERLNADLGTSGWSFTIVREGFTPTEAWVLGEITATIDGERCVRQQYGCEPIALGQSANGDLLKKAASDAIKKAASLLGIGLYLSIKEEREAMQVLMREASRQQPAPKDTSTPAAATMPPASGVKPTSSSMPATSAQPVRDAAVLTGAPPPTLQERWRRLVAEAVRINLPTAGRAKAIDPVAVGDAQLKKYADQLEARLYEVKEAAGAA